MTTRSLIQSTLCIFAGLVLGLSAAADVPDEHSQCKAQAQSILQRLQSEVVGELTESQVAAANTIVLEVCQTREQVVEAEIKQAVMQAREEEQEKAGSWLTESADKPGNARLKRKSH